MKEYIQSIRDTLTTDAILTQTASVAQTLLANNINYPHLGEALVDIPQLDTIHGDNFQEFRLEAKRFVRFLSKDAKKTKPILKNFAIHRTFKATGKNEKVLYLPVSLEFEDGQVLTGLARQYGEDADTYFNRKSFMKITKWFLNEQEITKQVITTKRDVIDERRVAKNIGALIDTFHMKFMKKNPNAKKVIEGDDELKAEIAELEARKAELLKQKNNNDAPKDNKLAEDTAKRKELSIETFTSYQEKINDMKDVKTGEDIKAGFDNEEFLDAEQKKQLDELLKQTLSKIMKLEAKEKEQQEQEADFNTLVKDALAITDVSDPDDEDKLATLFDKIQKHPIGLSKSLENEKLYNAGVESVGEHINKLIDARDAKPYYKGTPTDKEKADKLLGSYDWATWAIDDYPTQQKKEAKNKVILAELAKLNVTAIIGNNGKEEIEIKTPEIDLYSPENIDKELTAELQKYHKEMTVYQTQKGYYEIIEDEKDKLIENGDKATIENWITEAKRRSEVTEKDYNYQDIIKQISEDTVYKKIIKDSMGGVMYNVADKYNGKHLLDLWDKLSSGEKSATGGIMTGAMTFLEEQRKEEKPNYGEELDKLLLETDTKVLGDKLDALVEEIENDGLFKENEEKLNTVADYLTRLQKAK